MSNDYSFAMSGNAYFAFKVLRVASDFNYRPKLLKEEIKNRRKSLRIANLYFEDTINLPCGYQDAAGDRCERLGEEYMSAVHAYLLLRYGKLSRRLKNAIEIQNESL